MSGIKFQIVSDVVSSLIWPKIAVVLRTPLKRRLGRISADELTYQNDDDNSRQPGAHYTELKM